MTSMTGRAQETEQTQSEFVVSSGTIEVSISRSEDRLLLSVRNTNRVIVDGVTLGIRADGITLGGGSDVTRIERAEVREAFWMATGKSSGAHSAIHQELRLSLRDRETRRNWGIVVRAMDDGVAFRYVLPSDADAVVVSQEQTEIPAASFARGWLLEYQTWYETPRFGSDISDLAPGDYGFPLLLRTVDDDYALLTESAIDGRFSGAHPVFEREGDAARFRLRVADDEYSVPGGAELPWRVIIVGSLETVVASSVVDELAPQAAPALEGTGWIRPGRAAWSWWSSQYSGAYLDHQIRFADYAADRGWEHVLVDCGWDPTWMPDLVAHASRRGVQVHVWSSWSDLDGPEALAKLELWRSWGVAGIKVDFMESESQERYRWYDAIIAEAARVGLMVNFHGSVIPRGWARTHPHVMSYEGIRGAEYYVFYGDPLTARHNVIQPFTRNVVGSMDFTPVTFSAPHRETSDGHELALSVAYESGISHFADEVREYAVRPIAEKFLAEVPPTWHETRLLAGDPDSVAVIARRHGDRWFIGCIAAGPANTIDISLDGLIDGAFDAVVVTDTADGDAGLRDWHTSASTLTLDLAENGGAVVILSPTGKPIFRAVPRAEHPAPTLEPSAFTIAPGGTASITASAGSTLRLPPGWLATPWLPTADADPSSTRWLVTAPADAPAGSVGVVTAESRLDGAAVPVVSHARAFLPLAAGETSLATLPFLRCSNTVGPVERNESNGGGDPHDGQTMTVNGTTFAGGLGVSSPSSVEFFLDRGASVLRGRVGIDDETPLAGARAWISGDGRVLTEFNLESGADAVPFELDISDIRILRLSVEALGSGTADTADTASEAHVDWAEPTIFATRTSSS
jgi:hypothetical protein